MIRALRDDLIVRKPSGSRSSPPPPSFLTAEQTDITEIAVVSDNPAVRTAWEHLQVAVRLAHGEEMTSAHRNARRNRVRANMWRGSLGMKTT